MAWASSQDGGLRVLGLLSQDLRAPRTGVPGDKVKLHHLLRPSTGSHGESLPPTSRDKHGPKSTQTQVEGTWTLPLSGATFQNCSQHIGSSRQIQSFLCWLMQEAQGRIRSGSGHLGAHSPLTKTVTFQACTAREETQSGLAAQDRLPGGKIA